MYIIIEGIVGSGKTTQAKLLEEYLETKMPEKEVVYTREPGGTKISEAIRDVCQHVDFDAEMEDICEAYLYASARAQSLREVVKPVLDSGGIVIADRSFLTSIANQAFGRGLGFELVYDINKEAIAGFEPDLILFIDKDVDESLKNTNDSEKDKFENFGNDFYKKVLEGYKCASEHDLFKDVWCDIDGNGSIEEVHERVVKAVEKLL